MTLHCSSLGRGGHRDDRRRRLLAEDLLANSANANSANSANSGLQSPAASGLARTGSPQKHKSANYGDAEFLDHQLRPTDLIPRRLIYHLLLIVLGLAAIGGLMALYVRIPRLLSDPEIRLTLAELGTCGSLGNWIASLLLLAASSAAWIIYSVRRHKVDDYRGHYRIWLWAAACWFVMATDVAASLHQGFQRVMISFAGTLIAGDGSIWWVIPALLLVGSLGCRLLIDMWSSRVASAAMILAAAAYLTALVGSYHGLRLESELGDFLLVQGTLLTGHLLLAASMGLQARYVILDAEGAISKRPAKKKAEKKKPQKTRAAQVEAGQPDNELSTESAVQDFAASGGADAADSDDAKPSADEPADNTWVAVDPPHGVAQPFVTRASPAATPAASPLASKIAGLAGGNQLPTSAPANGKLNKADRKALKKRLLDERVKREQRKASNW